MPRSCQAYATPTCRGLVSLRVILDFTPESPIHHSGPEILQSPCVTPEWSACVQTASDVGSLSPGRDSRGRHHLRRQLEAAESELTGPQRQARWAGGGLNPGEALAGQRAAEAQRRG